MFRDVGATRSSTVIKAIKNTGSSPNNILATNKASPTYGNSKICNTNLSPLCTLTQDDHVEYEMVTFEVQAWC